MKNSSDKKNRSDWAQKCQNTTLMKNQLGITRGHKSTVSNQNIAVEKNLGDKLAQDKIPQDKMCSRQIAL